MPPPPSRSRRPPGAPRGRAAGGKADHWRMFNARSETVDTLGVFARLLRSRRCAVPLDGFYEWQDDEFKHGGVNKKQPYYVHVRAGKPMWVAGLHTECADGGASEAPLQSFTLITKASAPRLSWLHDRVPNAGLEHPREPDPHTLRR